MKFLSFRAGGKDSYGVVVGDDGVYDLGKRFAKKYKSLRDALKANKLAELRKAATGKKPDYKLSKVAFRPVIPNLAAKVICVGLNYREHQQETGRSPTDHPTLFLRWRVPGRAGCRSRGQRS